MSNSGLFDFICDAIQRGQQAQAEVNEALQEAAQQESAPRLPPESVKFLASKT